MAVGVRIEGWIVRCVLDLGILCFEDVMNETIRLCIRVAPNSGAQFTFSVPAEQYEQKIIKISQIQNLSATSAGKQCSNVVL